MTSTQVSDQTDRISTQLSVQAYQLAAQYSMGEPKRVYEVNTFAYFKQIIKLLFILGFVCGVVVFIIPLLKSGTLDWSAFVDAPLFTIAAISVYFCSLLPSMLAYATKVYSCSHGFISIHKRKVQAVSWEEIQRVELNRKKHSSSFCVVYLADQSKIEISRHIDEMFLLSQEMKLRAGLVEDADEREWIEQSLAQDPRIRSARRMRLLNPFADLIPKMLLETSDEASKLGNEHQMGNSLATYRANRRGIFRFEIFAHLVYWTLLLAFGLIFLEFLATMSFIPRSQDFWLAYVLLHLFLVIVLSLLFMPRFFARHTRLHVYEAGLISMSGTTPEAVCWDEIEKVVYCDTRRNLFHPFCEISLQNDEGDLALSRYLKGRDEIKALFGERVVTEPQRNV